MIIAGEINSGDIEKMKKKTCDKPEKKKSGVKCDICDDVFVNKHRFDLHMKKNHEISNVCGLCDFTFINDEDLKEHKLSKHSEIRSPDPKKMKIKEGDILVVNKEDEVHELMDIDDDVVTRSNMKKKAREYSKG